MIRYGWTWFGPEDDPDERGTAWIEVGPLTEVEGLEVMDADAVCEIICRNFDAVKREHPEWIEAKEAQAQKIANALTLREDVLDRLGEGFEFPASTREIAEAGR